MSSEFGYKLTQRADADLDDIVSYIALKLANPKAVTDFLDKLDNAIEEARAFPESGPLVTNEFLPVHNVRKKYVDNYIMYYLPDIPAKIIYILRIIMVSRI